jgi:hypothetical protein
MKGDWRKWNTTNICIAQYNMIQNIHMKLNPESPWQKKKKRFSLTYLNLNLRYKLTKSYIWSIALYGAESWNTSGSRSEINVKFSNVVLEKEGNQLD